MSELNFIVLTGRFCAGKDTQARRLIEEFGPSAEIIDTGGIYRGIASQKEEYAHFYPLIAPYIEEVNLGKRLVPDEVMIPIVQEIITERVRGGKETFLFTGFPRTVNQLRYFEQMILDFKNESNTKSFFIEYRITDQIMESRSKERRKKSSLSWDTDDGIKRRGNLYYKDIEPMIKVLQAEGKLITIDGSRSEDEIYRETISLLETYRISKER